jgi:hypothetical protein
MYWPSDIGMDASDAHIKGARGERFASRSLLYG